MKAAPINRTSSDNGPATLTCWLDDTAFPPAKVTLCLSDEWLSLIAAFAETARTAANKQVKTTLVIRDFTI